MDKKIYEENCDSLSGTSSRESSPKIPDSNLPVMTIRAASLTSSTTYSFNPMSEVKDDSLNKAQILNAVTKVLSGYDWMLVPPPTK